MTPNVLIIRIKKLITVIQKKNVFNVFSDMEKCSVSSWKSDADLLRCRLFCRCTIAVLREPHNREMRVMQAFGQLQIPFKYRSKDEITKKTRATIVTCCGGQSTRFSGRFIAWNSPWVRGLSSLAVFPKEWFHLKENIRPYFITRKVCHSCWVVLHRSWIRSEFPIENAAVSIYSVAAAEDKPVRFVARVFLVCHFKRHLRMSRSSNDACSRLTSASQVKCWRCHLMMRVAMR